jgi:hypothetical protein
MNSFKQFYESSTDELPNYNYISESSLSRIVDKIKLNKNDFAVISAYRKKYTKEENINRNRNLRYEFNKRQMGIYPLVGHWRECQIDGIEYKDCPENKLVDVIERSYLVIRPKELSLDDFKSLIQQLVKQFEQDCAILSVDGNIGTINALGNVDFFGSEVTLNKIAQAYSQYVKKMNVPFVFEGVEVPGSISGRREFKQCGLLYLVDNDKLKEWREING